MQSLSHVSRGPWWTTRLSTSTLKASATLVTVVSVIAREHSRAGSATLSGFEPRLREGDVAT